MRRRQETNIIYRTSNQSVVEVRVKPCQFLEQLAWSHPGNEYIASRASRCIELIQKADYWQGQYVTAWCSVSDVHNGEYVLDVNERHVMGSISGAYKYTYRKNYSKDDAFDLAVMLDEICFELDGKHRKE